MSDLTPREFELVALGAALGSNCVPCVEYHVAESRKRGLTDVEIHAAIQHADKIRQVPARKSLQVALAAVAAGARAAQESETAEPHGCGDTAQGVQTAETSSEEPAGGMMAMMSKMMAACGARSHIAGALSSDNKPAATSHTGPGCGCG